MNKEILSKELNELISELASKTLTKGESEVVTAKISIIQSKISSINQTENNQELKRIIRNNKRTTTLTLILSGLMLILASVTLFKNLTSVNETYENELNEIMLIQKNIDMNIDSIYENISKNIQIDTLQR